MGASSELAAMVAAADWSRTPLGPREDWSPALEAAVGICLAARFPMLVMWGPEETMIYNDGYAPMLQAKHPAALGIPGRDAWPEVWGLIGEMNAGVRRTGIPTWSEDLPLVLERDGFAEECYFTFSMSAIPEGGTIAGILATVVETTPQVVGERRMELVRQLAEVASRTRSQAELYPAIADALLDAPDLPFAELHIVGNEGLVPRLAVGDGVPASAGVVAAVLEREAPLDVAGADGLPVAIALPVRARGEADALGVLVAGLHPMRPVDAGARAFLALVAEGIAVGIADALAAEEDRRRATVAEELSAAKSTFLSTVSHEFRTPLTLLLGPIESALAGDLDHGTREELETAYRNALRLRRLVDSLLDFASREGGDREPAWRAVDLAASTAGLAGAFESAMRSAGLELDVDCPPLPRPVVVDPEGWERIVLNLLSNALKYTLQGTICVALAEEDGMVVLQVRDTGTGIPADELPRLFERFHRVQAIEGRSHEGSGIGLALVAEIADQHGGDVSVDSTLGAGSTFTVRLPYGHERIPADQLDLPSEAPTPTLVAEHLADIASWREDSTDAVADGGERRRVLIADDNADMRAYLHRLLAAEFEVQAVGDGRTALDRAREEPPDLVLTDVMMPGLDGLDLLTQLRAEPATARVPIVLLSARAGREASVDALDAGADDYLVKPFSAPELVARVRANLELGAMRERATAHQAALYAREHALVEQLQRRLLPTELPELPELRLDGRYLPASPETSVGGDWYDVMRLPDERILAVVGDVVGHGLEAAATMAHLRSATRAYAAEGYDAATIVDRVSTLVESSGIGFASTLVVTCLDPTTGTFSYSAAGHPPGLISGPDGAVRWLEHGLAPPLGVASAASARQVEDVLQPGETLLLYTDGLVERRTTELDVRMAQLAAADCGDLDGVLEAMGVAHERADDVALVTLQTVVPRAAAALELRTPDDLAYARGALRDWLGVTGSDEETTDEVVLAVSEAMINAIEHSGGSVVRVRAAADDEWMRIVVRDTGHWRRQGPVRERGQGLRIIRAVMDEVLVTPGADGTRVELRRRLER